jgi:hypothetical protein
MARASDVLVVEGRSLAAAVPQSNPKHTVESN